MCEFKRGKPGMRVVHRLLVGASVALLTACASVGPDFEKPDPAVSNEWIESTDPMVSTETAENKTWWLVFEDPILNELVSQAYRQNLPLQVAGLRILEARAQLGIAYGQNFPQVQQANGSAAYIKTNMATCTNQL